MDEVADYGKCQTTSIEDIDEDSWILELEDIEKDSGKVLKRCTKAEREIKGVRHSFHKGDVLYSKLRTYLNKVLVADEDGFCTTEIMPIKCGAYILPTYLCHVLRSKYFLDYTTQCGYGVKMPRLSTADACKAMIPVAPIEEQKRIAVMIENLDLLIDLLDENKQILQAGILQAKSKILDLAIHGKLVPQDASDEPASELLKRINPKAIASCDNPHYGILPENWCWV
ncbi:MAG: restriction endonuclease subunit S, partial [Paludibacteraceae bacterium]|nr:restriction endonuclease subunit S [Paludibacteraceae bacterium]